MSAATQIIPMGPPLTVDEVINRLVADRVYLIRTIINDAYATVLARYREVTGHRLALGNNGRYALGQALISMDASDDERELEDLGRILDVPYTGGGENPPVVDEAVKKMKTMAEKSDVGSAGRRVFPWLAATTGLQFLTGMVGGLFGGKKEKEAQEAYDRQVRAAQRAAQAQAAERMHTIKIVAIGLGVATVLGVLVWLAVKK